MTALYTFTVWVVLTSLGYGVAGYVRLHCTVIVNCVHGLFYRGDAMACIISSSVLSEQSKNTYFPLLCLHSSINLTPMELL